MAGFIEPIVISLTAYSCGGSRSISLRSLFIPFRGTIIEQGHNRNSHIVKHVCYNISITEVINLNNGGASILGRETKTCLTSCFPTLDRKCRRMKLCRFGPLDQETPGLIDDTGILRSLAGVLPDITAADLSPDKLDALRAINPNTLPVVSEAPRYGIPFSGAGKYICIGLNYRDHAEEAGLPLPSEPIVFMKAISALTGPSDGILIPQHATKVDWEVELAVIIGTKASYVSPEKALEHVAGYCVANDVSERSFQMQTSQWDKGKGCDTFGPLGPWLVTIDEIADPQALSMRLDVNGHRRQTGHTSNMIFDVRSIISHVSHYITLMPGDIIATGTPAGVGMGIKPHPIYLELGDVVELEIEGLGIQRQTVKANS